MVIVSRAVLALAALLPCAMAAPATAQIMTGVAPVQPFVLPSKSEAPRAAGIAKPEAAPAPAEAPSQATPIPVADLLHHGPNTLEGFGIFGETGDLRWPLYLTASQVAGPLRFQIAYLSAISVLPDVSSLTLTINGAKVGATPIEGSRTTRTVDFVVPAGLMKPGYNAVAIAVRQRHRVDCSIAATYELWTKIDPTQTGLIVDAPTAGVRSLDDIAGLLPRADGTMPIRVVLAGRTNPAHMKRLMTVTQQIAIKGRFQQPDVDFGPFATDPKGINLVLGTRAMLRTLPGLGDVLGGSGALVSLVALEDGARPTLVVSGDSDADVDQAIARLDGVGARLGTPDGLAAADLYPGRPVSEGQSLSLKDFGIASQDFPGRSMRQGFDLVLPPDVFAADYARGSIEIAGSYAAGLARDAQVLVAVNGHNAGQIALSNASGGTLRHDQLFLPLSLMRPGLNRIEIAAETPRPDETSCDRAASADPSPRFRLLDSSALVLPNLARIQRLPDLALMTSGGLPFLSGIPRLVVPKPDRPTMAAALSLVARLGVAAGAVVPFEFSVTLPKDDIGSILIVSPAQALDPAVMADVGLDPVAVEQAWRAPPKAKTSVAIADRWWNRDSDAPKACHLAAATTARPALASDSPTSIASDGVNLLDKLSALPAVLGTLARDAVQPAVKPVAIGSGTSLVLAQAMAGSSRHVTTIVTAPDAAMLQASIGCLTDPRIWTKLRGRLSVLDASDGTVTNTEATRLHYAAGSSTSLANSRLVIAGWFSLNPLAFVAIALLTALCLSGTTLLFVRGVGRSTK